MENIVRTVNGALLQTCQLLGLPFTVKNHTTLNEKLNIQNGIALLEAEMPRVRYAAIGNAGHRMVVGSNGIARPEPIQHTPRHAGLFNQVPFVLREPNNDLTVAERIKYRLRRVEVHDGKPYVAYYLKVLDLSGTVPEMSYKTVSDGVTNSTPFEPTAGDLNPTPPEVTSSGAIVTSGDYIAATAKVPFTMSENDVTEYLNVANIIYGSEDYAMISEIALCSGVDKNVMGDFNGLSSSYTDAIAVQIVNFMSVFFAMRFSNTGINLTMDMGSAEAMLTLS